MRGLRGLGIQGLANPVFSAGCPGGANLMSTIMSYNPIAYWPLNELTGVTAINYGSLGTAANGTHTGDTLAQIAAPGGGLAPYFNGNNNYVFIYSVALAAAFNGAIGSILIFWRIHTPVNTGIAFALGLSSNNRVFISQQTDTNGDIRGTYTAGGTEEVVNHNITDTDTWHLSALTWSKASDQVKFYVDSSQSGSTQTGIGTWAGALSNLYCYLGVYSGIALDWHGYLCNAAIFTSVLTQPQIATIYAAGI